MYGLLSAIPASPLNISMGEVLGRGPALSLSFMNATLDPRITFTGTNTRYYFNSSGLLVLAGTDVPRFGYDVGGSVLRGLLIEPASTNECLWSRDFTNAAWTKSNMTAALDETGIDGVATSASSLLATAANATVKQSITSTSALRSFSIFVKRLVGTGNVDLTLNDGAAWTTVAVTSSWARVLVSAAAATNPIVGIRLVASGDKIAVDCVQEEKIQPTSPIPTTTVAVARGADLASIGSTAFSNVFNQVEGTFLCEFYTDAAQQLTGGGLGGGAHAVLAADSGISNESYTLFADGGSGGIRFGVTDGNVAQALFGTGTIVASAVNKIAVSYKVNDFAVSFNGAAIGTDTVGTLPTPDRFVIGARGAGSAGNQYIRRVQYWNAALKFNLPSFSG